MAYQGNVFDPMRLYSAWVEGYSGCMKLYMESMDVFCNTLDNVAMMNKVGQMKFSLLLGKYLEEANRQLKSVQP